MAKLQFAERKAHAKARAEAGYDPADVAIEIERRAKAKAAAETAKRREAAAEVELIGERPTPTKPPIELIGERPTPTKAEVKAREAKAKAITLIGDQPPVAPPKIQVYKLETQRGVKTFKAVDESQARRLADRAGLEVTSIKETGEWKLTPQRQAELLRQAGYKHGRDKLELLIKAGALPEDTQIVRDAEGKWVAKRPREVAAIKELEKYKVGPGQYDLVAAIEAGIRDSILVRAGFSLETIKKTKALIAAHKGLQKVALEARAEALEHQQKELEELSKYRHDVAAGYDKVVSYYDIDQALRDGVKPGTLQALGFPKAAIAEAQKRIGRPPERVFEQFSSSAVKTLEKEYPKFATYLQGKELGFSIPHLQTLEVSRKTVGEKEAWLDIRKAIAEAKAKGIKTPTERELFTAWGKALPEYKKWVASLPKEHPEKVGLQHRLINMAMLVGTMVMPAAWGPVAATGKIVPAIATVSTVSRIASATVQAAAHAISAIPLAHTVANALQLGNLEKQWEALQAESPGRQEYYAEKAGVLKPGQRFEGLADTDKARVLINYTVPAGYSLEQWVGFVGEKMEAFHPKTEEAAAKLTEKMGVPLALPVVIAGGLAIGVIEKGIYAAQMPLFGAMLVSKIPEGQAVAFARTLGGGIRDFFFVELPSAIARNPALGIPRTVGLLFLSPKALVTYAKGLGVKASPRYVAIRSLARSTDTLRIEQVKNPKLKLTKAEMLSVIDKAVVQLVGEGKAKAIVTMKGGRWKLTIENTPYQRPVRGSVFHFTTDITQFGPEVTVRPRMLFASPHAALRFGLRSAIKGEVMKHPGIVEIHLTAEQISRFRAFKVLGKKGYGELEVAIPKGVRLSAVPGFGGKGVSFDLRTGTLPILRYTLASSPGWRGPTLGQLAKVRVEAAKVAAGDLVLGWHGRMAALKRMVAKDPRVAKANKSISQLKSEQPELEGAHGEIGRQRGGVPHPDGGTMHSRVTGIVYDPKTRKIALVMDKTESAYSLPGGRVEVQWVSERGPHGMTWANGISNQVMSELNFGLEGISYIGLYLGKVNKYALSGSRVFKGAARSNKLDPVGATKRFQPKGTPTEVKAAFWWNGKTPVTVYPAVYDILKGVAKEFGLDMSKVSIFKGDKFLLKARDMKFAKRIQSDKVDGWDAVYKKVKGDKHVVFDLDGTLIDAKGNLYPGAKAFLLKLKAEGKTISLWTHSPRARAQTILTRHGLWDLFKEKITREGYEPTGKDVAAYKGIKKIKGDVLVDNSPAQQQLGKQLGKRQKVISPEHKFSETDIKMMNAVEIANLKRIRDNIIRGEPLSFKEFLWSEPDITNLVELLQGRRRAIVVSEVTGRAVPQVADALHKSGLWPKYLEATRTLKGKALSKRVSQLYDEAIEVILNRDNGRLRGVLDKARAAAYAENYPYYASRYANYYYKGVVVPPERAISVIRTELRRDTPEVRRTAYRTELGRVAPTLAEYKPYVVAARKEPTPPPYRKDVTPVERRVPPVPYRVPAPPAPPYYVPPAPPAYKVPVPPQPYKVPIPPQPPAPPVPPPVPPPPPPAPPGPPRVPPPPPPHKFQLASLTEKQKKGIIAWKQGWCYKIAYPEGNTKIIINSRKPLAGVQYHTGKGSPDRSAVVKGGAVPERMHYNMGIVDVKIRVPSKSYWRLRKPSVRFVSDPKQTKGAKKGVRIARTRRPSPGISTVKGT